MGRSATRLLQRLGARLHRDEQGLSILEVVVSAALVAMLSVGLLTGFDVAGATSGTNKARAVAASIAQDDQERMRGLEVRTLVLAGPQTRTVKAGDVTYTVESTADIVVDSVDEGCTTGSGGIDYLKLRSEVTWPNMRIDPVVADSLMAPKPGSFGPDEGGLSVQVKYADTSPRAGLEISLSGPGSFSATTDENGCAFFPYIPAGDYNVSFSAAGHVTPAGITNVNEPVGVPEGAVSNKVFLYDQAARLTANFVTISGSGSQVTDHGTSFAAAHTNIPAPGALFFTSATQVSSITTAFTLFPFSSPYSAYAGSCVDARPELYGQTSPTVLLGPGGSGSVNVVEPSLDVRVRYWVTSASPASYVPVNGATVRFYNNTCGTVFTYPSTTGSGGASAGRLRYPGMPYGNYDICAEYDADGSGGTPRRFREITNVLNGDPDPEDFDIDIPASDSYNGSCPAS